ncbi:MAG: L,D-transpeptidase [Anaerolineales bacterium]
MSGIGALTFISNPLISNQKTLNNQQGRVINERITVHTEPSFSSEIIRVYWRDSIIPITKATIGDSVPEYNRVWYQIDLGGYAHSGNIQPVQTRLNLPTQSIPQGGTLAEVTVPYTDARWEPSYDSDIAYRFYYETTHWVIDIVYAEDNEPWYRILDDKWELTFYVLARHLRVIPKKELSTLSPGVPPQAKRIEVQTGQQIVVAYEWERPVFVAKTATGAKFSNGNFATPPGRHTTFHKRPSRHMAAGNLAYNGYDLPGVPWVSYITKRGVAFHGTYWHNDYGRPRSHGCINLSPSAAKWIYLWTLPHVPYQEQRVYEDIGTSVDVI